jgi:uncharacterized membrane protein
VNAARAVVRWALAAFMVVAGIGHLLSTDAFLGQTPTWLPWRTPIIWASGVVEIGLGTGLALTTGERRRRVGWALAIFYVVVFPGNVYQAVARTDAFGLDTPLARWARLLFQPILILAALWSSGAWRRPSPSGRPGSGRADGPLSPAA